MRILDPNQVLGLFTNLETYSAVPGITSDTEMEAEFFLYRQSVRDLGGESCGDILAFWSSISHLAFPDCFEVFVCANKFRRRRLQKYRLDAERSFSVYRNIVSEKRHNLKDSNTKMLCSLYFNAANEDLYY